MMEKFVKVSFLAWSKWLCLSLVLGLMISCQPKEEEKVPHGENQAPCAPMLGV